MYFSHPDISKAAHIGCGSLLIATLGGIFCIILIISVTKATGYRFLVWTGIGQVIYFAYSFWHSNQRSVWEKASMDSPPQPRHPARTIALDGMHLGVGSVAVVCEPIHGHDDEITTCYL